MQKITKETTNKQCQTCAWVIEGECLFERRPTENCEMHTTEEEAERYDELFWGEKKC